MLFLNCSYFQVILKHFWLKRKEIKEQIELWLADQEVAADQKTGVKAKSYQSISHNTVLLKVGHNFMELSPSVCLTTS